MKNIKSITALGLALLFSATIFGQQAKPKKPTKEKVKAMKVGYITEKLDLSSAEAQKFWPVYNEFENKMDEFRKQRNEARKHKKDDATLSDAEIEKLVDNHIIMEQKELDIKKEYHAKFKAVLPIKKVAKLYQANEQFKRDLLKKIRNHSNRGQNGHKGPPPGGRH